MLIMVTRINGSGFVINEAHIEMMEANPDTVITLVNGHRYVVKESVPDLLQRIVEYKQK